MIRMQYSHFTDLMRVDSVTLQHTLYLERKGNRIASCGRISSWRFPTMAIGGMYWGAPTRAEGRFLGRHKSATAWSGLRRSCMRICVSIYPHVLAVVMTSPSPVVYTYRGIKFLYVPNLAGQSHRAAIPEARRPQRLPHTDLYAFHRVYTLQTYISQYVSHRRASYSICIS